MANGWGWNWPTMGGGAPAATPWGSAWGGMPWAEQGWPKPEEASKWLSTFFPWYQLYQQAGQWGTEFDWRKVMDEWNKAFQEQQFGWQKESDVWSRGFQEEQWRGQLEEAERQRRSQEEQANIAAFGRRWRPNVRWM